MIWLFRIARIARFWLAFLAIHQHWGFRQPKTPENLCSHFFQRKIAFQSILITNHFLQNTFKSRNTLFKIGHLFLSFFQNPKHFIDKKNQVFSSWFTLLRFIDFLLYSYDLNTINIINLWQFYSIMLFMVLHSPSCINIYKICSAMVSIIN